MPRTAEDYRRVLAAHLAALGREDIAIADAREEGDILRIEFVRGTMREEGSIPLHVLHDPTLAQAALSGALLALSTAIERRHIEKAKGEEEERQRSRLQCPVCAAEFETGEERENHNREQHPKRR